MNDEESMDLAATLRKSNGDRPFELSMADTAEYDLMRTAFDRLGRATGPDGEFFIVRVFAAGSSS